MESNLQSDDVLERRALRSDERGFIVLGCLGIVVVVLVTMVTIGKLIGTPERYYLQPGHRELRYAARAVEVRYGAAVAARLERGEMVWGERVEDGRVAVFRDRAGRDMLGFVAEAELRRDPPPRSASYRTPPMAELRSLLLAWRGRRG